MSLFNNMGDPLPKLYITNNPKDSRLRDYQDSLKLYNNYQHDYKLIQNPDTKKEYGITEKNTKGNFIDLATYEENGLTNDRAINKNIKPVGFAAYTRTDALHGTYKGYPSNPLWDSKNPVALVNSGAAKTPTNSYADQVYYIPQYKKPVQPVVYQPQQVTLPTSVALPAPVTPPPIVAPKVPTKFQIQETNFGAPIKYQYNPTTKQYVLITDIPKDTPQSDITTKPWVNEMKGHAQGGQVNNNQKQNNMGSLYYMAGGWHSKNKYATGGTTLPYQMAPEYEQQGYNYDTTKKVGQAGLAVTKASGYNPYVAAGAAIATAGTFVYDIFKSKEENEAIYNRNQGVGEGVKETLAANSPYSGKGGYNQINAAQGGPIWHMLGKNPQQFQMDQNNNQTSYRMGGGVGNNQDYGIIEGNGSPTADDKRMDVEAGSFVVPFDKGGKIKSILEHLGYNPNKTINPNNSFATGGNKSPINISSKETYLNPEMADEVAEYLGGDEEMEKQLSPNSPHNIYAAMGGKIGNNYYPGGPGPSYTTPTLADELEGIVSPADQAQAALDATRAAEAARIANNEPFPVVPIKLPPPAAAPVVPPASQKTMEQLVDENDAIGKTDEMTEEARRQNKTMLGINTAKAAGMGIWNALQKNPEMPKQGRFNPMLISSNTEAMGAEQNYLSAKAGATARRAATEGNINQTVSNASIQANTLAQQVTDANQRSAINQRVNEANVGTLNQASLYNLQADNQYNQMNAERTAAFKQNKATAISGNINDAAKGYNNYANANLGINALEKGYNSGKINQALYQKAMNNPESLTPEEIIQLNSITGGKFNPANLS